MNEWKTCNRCGNVLMGNERLSETCNRCLDLGYQSMSDEAYDAIDPDEHERQHERQHEGRTRTMKRLTIAAAIYAALQVWAASAMPAQDVPAFVPPAPVGCTVTRVFEDHSALGVCAGSYVIGTRHDGSWHPLVVERTLHLHDAAGRAYDVPVYYQ